MTTTKRSWDVLSEEKRRKMITAIIDFFKTERDEEIGVIAAGEILDFMLQALAPEIYNRGVDDSLKFINDHFQNLEVDINALLKK